jgi:cytochrome c
MTAGEMAWKHTRREAVGKREIMPMLRAVAVVSAAVFAAVLPASVTSAGDAARGEKRFEECASCHSMAAGQNGVGPSLHDIVGRQAASLDDFRYSPAMRRSGIIWTTQMLDTFIADPQKLVPANRMPYAGLMDPNARADLIAYLEAASH